MITAKHVNYYKDSPYYKKYKTSGQNFETIDRPDIHVSDAHPRYVASFDKSENQGFAGYIFQQRNDLYASSYTLWANTSSDSDEYGAFIYVGSGNYGNGIALGIGDSSGFSGYGSDLILVIDGYNVIVCGTKPEGWHHYGLVLEDNSTIYVYVDGQLFYTASEYTDYTSQPYTFVIGNSGMPNEVYDNSGAWGNKIARVCVWNKTLSQSEVESDYNANQTAPTFSESGLYAYYSMCTEGDLLIDFGGKAGLQSDKMTWTYDSTSDKVRPGPAPAIVDGVIYPPSFSYNNTGWITGCYKVLDSFSPNGKSWEYLADFETPDDLTSYGEPFSAGIFGGIGTADGCTPIYMQVSTDGQNKKLLTAFLSSNGTSWDISNQTLAEILIVQPNTRYRIKAVYDQSKYQWFMWNFTTNEWDLKFTLNDSRAVYDGLAMQMGTNRGRNNGFGGNIYVKNCHIKVNDCYVWRGDMDGMGCDLTAFNSPDIVQEKWGNVPYVPNPIPQQYNNYYLTGTYTFEDGILSKVGSATNTYMRSYNKVTLGDNFEIVIKARWNGAGSGLFNLGLNHGIQIQLSGADFKAYAGDQSSTWDVYGQMIKSSLPSNTWFWTKVTYDGTNFNTYYSTDGENYTLADTSTASLDFSEEYIYIGCDTGFGANGWGGDIDLTETYVKVNGAYAWQYIQTSNYPITLAKNMYYDYPLSVKNATIPNAGITYNIYGWDGVVWKEIMTDWSTYFDSTANVVGTSIPYDGNFECGSGKYITLKNTSITPNSDTWEIGMKFYTSQQNPGGVLWGYNRDAGGTRHRNTQIYLGNNSIGICISYNGTSWETYGSASNILQPERWVWIKFIYDGTKYVLKVSYDNSTWEDWITYTSSTPIYGFYDTSLCAGDNGSMMSAPPYCTVDLKECYLKVADEYVWRGNNLVIDPVEYPQTRISFDANATMDYVNLLSWGEIVVECGYDDPDAESQVLQGTHTVVATSSDYDESETEDKYYEVENE